MNETLLWLLYVIGAGLAFGAVRRLRWPISLAMLAPSVLGTAIWYLAVELGKEENEPAWINVDLGLNFSFFLIFAAAGAALAQVVSLREARRSGEK
jgi:lipoprotein signal peptidase